MPEGRPRQIPVVGVMGSGATPHAHLAEPLGRALAGLGVHLLTGGGSGVMESVSRAFSAVQGREGLVIGILPAGDARPDRADADPQTPPGYPNPWVELAIRTHLDARGDDGSGILSRNHINILSSDVVIALPGSSGTASKASWRPLRAPAHPSWRHRPGGAPVALRTGYRERGRGHGIRAPNPADVPGCGVDEAAASCRSAKRRPGC